MAANVKFPIRAKLLILMSALVGAATLSYLALAVNLFKEDKTKLVYELNASSVKTLAAEVEATLTKFADKAKLLAQGFQDSAWTQAIFDSEPDLVSFALYQAGPQGDWKQIVAYRNARYLKMYGASEREIDRIRETIPIPFTKVIAKRSVALNSTLKDSAPILTLAVAVRVKGEEIPRVAVVDLRLDKILALLQDHGIAQAYLIDEEGRVVAHPDPATVASRVSMGDIEIVRDAIEAPVDFQLKHFEWKGSTWLGAYAKVPMGGLRAISQVEQGQAYRAAYRLIQKSLIFCLIIITVSLLVSGWLARTFTEPLRKLLAATDRIARWQFGESIHVKTNDEIASLARSFNSMASDLQRQHGELEAHQKELELKVKERTAALEAEKKQAAAAQDALIRTTRLASLGELAGATAHEILNPVNNINIRVEKTRNSVLKDQQNDVQILNEIVSGWKKAYDEGGWDALQKELSKPANKGKPLIEEDLGNLVAIAADESKRIEQAKEDTEFLSKEVARISRIINGMRSLSRVGGERKPIDIHVPIDDTLVALNDILVKRKVAVVKEYSAESRELFAVVADRDELVQVFSNLMRNALHAIDSAKRNPGTIRVSTRRKGGKVEVRIIDNGSGIAKENVARVFEPSFTTKSVEEGTGLGLSISRRLVRAFGGDIEVEKTEEGSGTTFLVWFPTV